MVVSQLIPNYSLSLLGSQGWDLGGNEGPSPRAQQELRPGAFNPGRTRGEDGIEG